METVFTILFNGISLSSILLLAAIGLSVTFGLMRVINMAHGEFIMIGSYTTFLVQNFFIAFLPKSAFDFYYPVAIIFSFLVGVEPPHIKQTDRLAPRFDLGDMCVSLNYN